MAVSPAIASWFFVDSDVDQAQFLAWGASVEGIVNAVATPRTLLAANATYFVRTDGSDSNTGLVNTAGGAFLTLQKALNTAATLDAAGLYTITIQLGNGTYTGAGSIPSIVGPIPGGSPTIIIQGNTSDASQVVISTTAANAIQGVNLGACVAKVQWLTTQTTTSGVGLYAGGTGTIQFGNLRHGACASGHLYADYSAVLKKIANCATVGNTGLHYAAVVGGTIDISGFTDTYSGTLTFTYTAYTDSASRIYATGATQTVASGSVTATRYSSNGVSAITTGGAGASFFPGNVAGATANGGVYY